MSPVTSRALAVLNAAIEPNASDVRVQFRNFPLAFHPQAQLAHEAAMIAARSGRFWQFAEYLLAHPDAVREQDLIALAGRLGLDEKSFAAALQEAHSGSDPVLIRIETKAGHGAGKPTSKQIEEVADRARAKFGPRAVMPGTLAVMLATRAA